MARKRGPTLVQRSRRVSPNDKAYFHDVKPGTRPFLMLRPEELAALGKRLGRGVKVRMERGL